MNTYWLGKVQEQQNILATYDYGGTAASGKLASATTTVTPYVGQAQTTSVSYGYDVLGRLTSAAAGAAWAQTLTYDGYGNLAQKTGTGAAAAVGTADSRGLLNSVKNQIGAHDAAGNAILPAGVYDFDNRLTEWGNERYGYDASNKRVTRASTVNPDKFVTFWVGSYKMGEYRYLPDGSGGAYPAGAVGEWGMIGGRVVKPSDRLGSDISGGRTYLPYGEELNPSPGGRYKFATYWRDETGLDYADQRYYSPGSGRFLTSDPYMASGGGANDPTLPSSWNRYVYVLGDPVNFGDSEGTRIDSACGVHGELGDYSFKCITFVSGDYDGGGRKEPGKVKPPDECDEDDPTNAKVIGFLRNHSTEAETLAKETGINADFILAWAAFESGYGKGTAATVNNNFFGLTTPKGGTGGWVGAVVCADFEGKTKDGFACFEGSNSILQSARAAFGSQDGRYLKPALEAQAELIKAGVSDIEAIGAALARAGFNSEPINYGRLIQGSFRSLWRRKKCLD